MIKRLLIFDDDKGVVNIMKFILKEQGWEVFNSPHSNHPVETVRSVEPSIIIMDNNIPDYGGIYATQCIKANQEFDHIPVIYFTAHSNIQELAQEAGADSYLTKPFELYRLYELLNELSASLT